MATTGRSDINMTEEKRRNYNLKRKLFDVLPKSKKNLCRKISALKYTDEELKYLIEVFDK